VLRSLLAITSKREMDLAEAEALKRARKKKKREEENGSGVFCVSLRRGIVLIY